MSEESVNKAATAFGLALFAAIVFGVGSCVNYERSREKACLRAGGTLTYVGGNRTCARVTIDPLPVVLP